MCFRFDALLSVKAALSCSSSKYRSLIKRKSVATSIVKALRSLVVYEKYTRREPEGLFRAIHLFGAFL